MDGIKADCLVMENMVMRKYNTIIIVFLILIYYAGCNVVNSKLVFYSVLYGHFQNQ